MKKQAEPAITLTQTELDAAAAQQDTEYAKNRVRASINNRAGDSLSLLGTTTDIVQLLLVAHCELIEAVRTATTVAQIKTAIVASPVTTESAALLTKIKSGKTKMPYKLKGVKSVIDDAERRATVAHDAIVAGNQAIL